MTGRARYLLTIAVFILVVVSSYALGKMSAQKEFSATMIESMSLTRLLRVSTDLGNLELLRNGNSQEVILGMEQGIDSALKTLDIDVAKNSPLTSDHFKVAHQALVKYVDKYKISELNPERNEAIRKVLGAKQ